MVTRLNTYCKVSLDVWTSDSVLSETGLCSTVSGSKPWKTGTGYIRGVMEDLGL